MPEYCTGNERAIETCGNAPVTDVHDSCFVKHFKNVNDTNST